MQTIAIENQKFIVEEFDRTTKKTKAPRLVASLEPYRKRYASQADIETFHSTVMSAGPALWGLTVKEATEEDIANHGGEPEVVALANLYGNAEAKMKADKLTAARGIVKHLSEKVKDKDALESFLYIYGLNTAQVMAMHKLVRDEDGTQLDDAFVTVYSKLVEERAATTASPRKAAAVKTEWNKVAKANQK
ncbi:hypothetical protein ABC270_05985 [Curtobacterium sp. 1P10AnD]|uniref:hypothetical protein n=1 Tax=Curtobacterium sp. 1P10AnD TaxID=3132283 RepID=UPI00399F6210